LAGATYACDRDANHIGEDDFSVGSTMPKAHTHCYSIEIKDAKGVRLFSAKAYWTEKERRIALGQIMRLAGMPEVNFYIEPALEPQSEKATPRRQGSDGSQTKLKD
jgi:hypothetical protein